MGLHVIKEESGGKLRSLKVKNKVMYTKFNYSVCLFIIIMRQYPHTSNSQPRVVAINNRVRLDISSLKLTDLYTE